ncbi:MAG: 2-succinyl-5-enolpyruvyl-6-hydroxy-3-cyclohexene-1-carboxylic-acid synthase, partial [Oligoflexales bacterium]|nr:2-succinyl-5-enolpyruvyl-6-hydroxy-3-cyclohexene-1-carboxylic-acid synthase [Oligoflexales bacterium]
SVLISTSGTAGANYYPALIEAFRENVPIIAITADRPFEAIRSGANQVIEQDGLYGSFVKRSLSLPAACKEIAPEVLLLHAAHMIDEAHIAPMGPVHVNIPFREPLEPGFCGDDEYIKGYLVSAEKALCKRTRSNTRSSVESAAIADTELLREIWNILENAGRGLVIAGRPSMGVERGEILAFTEMLGWPCFYDITSSLKHMADFDISIPDPESEMMRRSFEKYRPDVVLRLGRGTVTKHFDRLLREVSPRFHIIVSPETGISDPSYCLTHRLSVREDLFVRSAPPSLKKGRRVMPPPAWRLTADAKDFKNLVRSRIRELPFSLPAISDALLSRLAGDSVLFLGNSLSIRVFDSLAFSDRHHGFMVKANRGVSGIEGNLSSSLGISDGSGKKVTALLGDISLIHDLNAVLELGRHRMPLIAIVVNNGGGEIFRKMPISSSPEVLVPYLSTPHSFDFSGICRMAGLNYAKAAEISGFCEAYDRLSVSDFPALIECAIPQGIDAEAITSLLSL